MIAIETRGLTRYYNDLCAVDHLDLSVAKGELFAFLGPNGAGKTTTIRLLTGLIRPTSGTALLDGLDVTQKPLEVKSRVGVVPERSNLYNELSARENLIFVTKLYGLPRRSWATRADELLTQFGLADRATTPFRALSRGLKRRLTIAAALLHHPSILLLDEPTTGLDVQSARSLRNMIEELRASGVTVFLTTHLIAEAERLCDRVAILVKGKLIALGTPAELRAQCTDRNWLEMVVTPSPSEGLQVALSQLEEVTSLSRKGNTLRLGISSVENALCAVSSLLGQFDTSIQAVQTISPSLEDAFVKLTGIDVETLQSSKPGGGGQGR